MCEGKQVVVVDRIAEALAGLKRRDWNAVKDIVDRIYNTQTAKIELGDFEEMKRILSTNLGK